MADYIICNNPNCGFKGEARLEQRGSMLLGLFLMLFGFVPGFLYLLIATGWTNYCPRCNANMGRARSGPSSSKWLLIALGGAVALMVVEYSRPEHSAPPPAPPSNTPPAWMNPGPLPTPAAQDAGAGRHRRRHSRGQ